MKALVMNKANEAHLEERESPVPGPGEVLVRMGAMGICGSDLHIYEGDHPIAKFPHIPGHEASGEVVKTGQGVEDIKPGQHVVIEPVIECGKCYSCRIGVPHNCVDLRFRGVSSSGGAQEFLVMPRNKVYPVPNEWSHEKAALAEPLGIGFESAKVAGLIPGDTVAIFGAGPIGLAVLLAVKKGNHRALVFDVLEPCLQRASALGADEVVNLRNADALKSINDFTNGEGANVIFECAGKASNFPIALEGISICGRIVVVGLLFDSIPLVPFALIRKRIGLLGTRNSNMIPEAIELLKERPEIPEHFISHRLPMHEAQKGFQLLQQRSEDICKIMLLWE